MTVKGRPHWGVYFDVKCIVFACQKMSSEMFFLGKVNGSLEQQGVETQN